MRALLFLVAHHACASRGESYADWDVRYVKNDWCWHKLEDPKPHWAAFAALRDALNSTGIPMVYSIHWNYDGEMSRCHGGILAW